MDGFGAVSAAAEPSLTVSVYNYSPASAVEIRRAEQEAAAVFQRAGIEVSWVNCPIDNAVCGTESTPPDVILRILGRRPGGALKSPLGYAIPGGYASVYALNAYSSAECAGVDGSVVLGIAIGHELGHVLLGGLEAHSRRGIMQAKWGKKDLRAADQRALGFAPDEARKLRAEVVLRSHTIMASITR
ncbi:MAG: hypothetical protein ABSE56_24465 [Bryobacteraceae bacterium]